MEFCDMHENFADFQYAKCEYIYCGLLCAHIAIWCIQTHKSGTEIAREKCWICVCIYFEWLVFSVFWCAAFACYVHSFSHLFWAVLAWFRNGKRNCSCYAYWHNTHTHTSTILCLCTVQCIVCRSLDSLILTASFALKFSLHSHCAHGQTVILCAGLILFFVCVCV